MKKNICYIFIILTSILFLELTYCFEVCRVEYERKGCNSLMVEGVVAYCNGRNRPVPLLPNVIPKDVIYLSLKEFNFKFTWQKTHFNKFTKLECLYVGQSEVHEISYDAFSENFKLKDLTMKDNRYLSTNSFNFVYNANSQVSHLTVENSKQNFTLPTPPVDSNLMITNLKTLILRGNWLKSFAPSFYTPFKNLEVLDIGNNFLTSLNWTHMTQTLKSLNDLRLDHNRMQIISESAVTLFQTVNKLHLGFNKYHCNCHMKWLKNFLNQLDDNKILDDDKMRCQNSNSSAIRTAPDHLFTCQKPSIPEISKLSRLNRIEFNCSSTGDPAPDITIHLTDVKHFGTGHYINKELTRTVIIPASKDASQLKTISPNLIVGSTWIRCEAKNDAGDASREMTVEPDKIGRSSSSTTNGIYIIMAIFISFCIQFRTLKLFNI